MSTLARWPHPFARQMSWWLITLVIGAMLAPMGPRAQAASQIVDSGSASGVFFPTTTIAPDGRSIAILKRESPGGSSLSVFALATRQSTHLATWSANYQISGLSWSPDSQSIAVVIDDYGFNSLYSSIEVLAADGSHAQQVAQLAYQCQPTNALTCALRWLGFSADSRSAVYQTITTAESAVYRASLTPGAEGTVRLNPDSIAPSFCVQSPALDWLACYGAQGIVALPIAGPGQRGSIVFSQSSTIQSLRFWFSPRGSRLLIAASSYPLGETIYSVPPDGSSAPVALNAEPITFPFYGVPGNSTYAFSPDDRYALIGQTAGTLRVPLAGPAEAATLLVSTASNEEVGYTEALSITSDGQHLILNRSAAFASIGHAYDPAKIGVFSIPIDGPADQLTRLTANTPYGTALASDGRSLLYHEAEQPARLMVVPVTGPSSAAREVFRAESDYGYFAFFAVQGGFIIRDNMDVYSAPTDGHRAAALLYEPSAGETPIVTQIDDSGLVFLRTSDTALIAADLGQLTVGFSTAATCAAEPDQETSLQIALSSVPVSDRSVGYQISGGTAQPSDYTLPVSGTITFAPGERFQHLPLGLSHDMIAENDETLEITLRATSDLDLAIDRMTVTIRDQGSCQSMLPLAIQPAAPMSSREIRP
jgi:Calx-beta domain